MKIAAYLFVLFLFCMGAKWLYQVYIYPQRIDGPMNELQNWARPKMMQIIVLYMILQVACAIMIYRRF